MVKFGGEIGTLYQIFTPCTPSPNTNGHLLDFWGGPIACQDAEGFFTGGFPNTYIYTTFYSNNITTIFNAQKRV